MTARKKAGKDKSSGYDQIVEQIRKQVKEELKEETRKEEIIETSFIECSDGRLAESAYDPKREPSVYFIVWDGEKATETNEIRQGEKIKKIYRPLPEALVKEGAVLLPTKVEPYESEHSLLHESRDFIHARVNIPESYEILLTQYIPFTYIYDRFDALPYIRALGPPGSGKSTLINNVMAHLVYKGQRAAGALTPASLYRTIDKVRGTLIIDEMDLYRSDQSSDIIKILNLGFQKGSPVYRCDIDEKNRISTANFSIFGPKLLATRERFQDDALESRCITLHMYKHKRADNPYQTLDEESKKQALSLRNKFLLWRFKNYRKNWKLNESLEIKGIEARINQIILPLMTTTDDPQKREELAGAAKDLQEQLIEQRGTTSAADILNTIIIQMKKATDNPVVYPTWQDKIELLTMKEIAEQYNVDKSGRDAMTPRKMGWYIQNKLRLRTDKHPTSRRWYIAVLKKTNYEKLQDLTGWYGENKETITNFVCRLPINYLPTKE